MALDMERDRNRCYRALKSRDSRFDGRFFTGVRTTGIYCRPICPARLPKLENVIFYRCAAAAEEAGFRPCKRCRPETAPGTPPWLGTSVTVERALRYIEYIAMRALRDPDAFPTADLGLRKALSQGTDPPISAAALARQADSWRPWRAYAAMFLWRSLSPGDK